MLTIPFRLSTFLLIYFCFASTGHTELTSGNKYINALREQLDTLASQLAIETESLERARKLSSEAEKLLADTTVELKQIKIEADKDKSESKLRELRIVNVKYRRHTKKVERRLKRALQKQKTIARIQNDIRLIQSDLRKLHAATKPKAIDTKQTENIAQQAEPNAKQPKSMTLASTAKPSETKAIKRLATPNITSPNPASEPPDWPYLSLGSYRDRVFAAGRLRELKSKKRELQTSDAPLAKVQITSSRSFDRIKMEYIGDNLYSTVKTVSAGKQLFEIFDLREWHDIPQSDNQTTYRFIFDISQTSKPRLIMFRENLIQSEIANAVR